MKFVIRKPRKYYKADMLQTVAWNKNTVLVWNVWCGCVNRI